LQRDGGGPNSESEKEAGQRLKAKKVRDHGPIKNATEEERAKNVKGGLPEQTFSSWPRFPHLFKLATSASVSRRRVDGVWNLLGRHASQ
jgi:hypothetical protein